MKSSLSHALTLGIVVAATLPGRAQNNAAPPQAAPQVQAPLNNLSLANSDALAMIGAFYNQILHAKTYRGHLVITKTVFKTGTTPQKMRIEVDSSWTAHPTRIGATLKNFLGVSFSSTVYGRTSVDHFDTLVDAAQTHVFWRNKAIWSESNEVKTGAEEMLPSWALVPWKSALSAILSQGKPATTEHRSVDGREQVVLKIGWSDEYVFDAASGFLLSYKSLSVAQNLEYVWSKTELDAPLSDSIFEWKTPAGATQVEPKATRFNFVL